MLRVHVTLGSSPADGRADCLWFDTYLGSLAAPAVQRHQASVVCNTMKKACSELVAAVDIGAEGAGPVSLTPVARVYLCCSGCTDA